MNKTILYLLSIFILLNHNIRFAQSQNVQPKQPSINSQIDDLKKEIEKSKSEIAELKDKLTINKEYQTILKETNNQLSLWYSPYKVILAILTIIIAIIGFAVSIFIVNEFRVFRNARKQHEKTIDELEQIITELRKEKSVEKDPDKQQKIQEKIDNVSLQKDMYKSTTPTFFSPVSSGVIYIDPALSTQARKEALIKVFKDRENEKKDSEK